LLCPFDSRSTRARRTNHSVHLSGDEEPFTAAPGAPTPADSRAQGQAVFHIADDDSSFDYKLIASNITQAHIHCGPSGVNVRA